jgi:hypothetical protein
MKMNNFMETLIPKEKSHGIALKSEFSIINTEVLLFICFDIHE